MPRELTAGTGLAIVTGHMTAARHTAIAFVLLATVAACGTTEGTPVSVTIRGAVFTDFHDGLPCADGRPAAMRPDEISGIALTFSNPEGVDLGGALTGPLRTEQLADGCRFLADYQLSVPPAVAYRVEFDPPEPRTMPGGGYFDGADQLAPQEIRHDVLAAAGYSWSFEAPPAFVVP